MADHYSALLWEAQSAPHPSAPRSVRLAPATLHIPAHSTQSKAVAVALNQKVVDKFFKGLRRGGASSAKTRGFHTQLDEGPETP